MAAEQDAQPLAVGRKKVGGPLPDPEKLGDVTCHDVGRHTKHLPKQLG